MLEYKLVEDDTFSGNFRLKFYFHGVEIFFKNFDFLCSLYPDTESAMRDLEELKRHFAPSEADCIYSGELC